MATIPASTVPTPPGAPGIRFAAMPTKNPWTMIANGIETSNAWKLAQRIPMLAAQKPSAPMIARAPRFGSRTKSIAIRVPTESVAGTVASFRAILPKRASPVCRASLRSKSCGIRARLRKSDDAAAGDRGGNDRQAGRVLARQNAGPQKNSEDDQSGEIDGVGEDEERDHAVGCVAARDPGLAKRPVGEDDPAGAAGGEKAGRGKAGKRDLVALAPAQADELGTDDAAEEGDVGSEHRHRETEADRDPERVALVEAAERVVEIQRLRAAAGRSPR